MVQFHDDIPRSIYFTEKIITRNGPNSKQAEKEIARKGTPFRAIINLCSTVQGIDSGLGVCDVELLDVSDLAQTGDLAIDRVEFAGGLELALPGILVVARHIVVGVVACNDHQGTQDDLGVAGGDSLDDVLAGSLLRLTLDGADEDVLVARAFI